MDNSRATVISYSTWFAVMLLLIFACKENNIICYVLNHDMFTCTRYIVLCLLKYDSILYCNISIPGNTISVYMILVILYLFTLLCDTISIYNVL